MNYAKSLRIIRAAKGISQQELAHKTQLDKSLLSRIEAGERNLSLRVKKIIADTLGIPQKLIDLLAMEKPQKPNEKIIEDIGKSLLLLINEADKKS